MWKSLQALFDRSEKRNRRRPRRRAQLQLEQLEDRVTPSVDVLTYHNDLSRDGQNLSETALTTSNVNSSDFGQQFNTSLNGQVRGQALVMTGVNVDGAAHDVVFVATMASELYALDADTGQILWQDDVLPSAYGGSVTPFSGDSGFTAGFMSTPVIDASNNTLYAVTKLTETVGSTDYCTWWMVAVNVGTGAYVDGGPSLFASGTYPGSIPNGDTYVSGPTVNGTGFTPPGSPSGTVAFDAGDASQRTALTLNDGSVFMGFSSATDAGYSHGWILGFSETNLQPTAVFCTTPNNGTNPAGPLTTDIGQGGVWQAGGGLVVDASGNMYFTVGQGGNDYTFNAQGFPSGGDYGDSLVKVAIDPSTNPSNQNINGWGLKVMDYFTPDDAPTAAQQDWDLSSGAPVLLPNGEMIVAGKDMTVYVVNPNNLGHYNATFNNIIETLPEGAVSSVFMTPAYFDGNLYIVGSLTSDNTNGNPSGHTGSYLDNLKDFSVSTSGQVSASPVSEAALPSTYGDTVSVSADGSSNGIIWEVDNSGFSTADGYSDQGTDELRAYNALNLNDELFQATLPTPTSAWTVPTVANGWVYVPEDGGLVGFSLNAASAPQTPTGLTAAPGNGQVSLSWNASAGAAGYNIYRSTSSGGEILVDSGVTGTSFIDTGLSNGTTYYYQVTAVNSTGESGRSSEVSATPSTSGNLVQDPGFEASNTLAPYWNVDGTPDSAGEDLGTGSQHSGNNDAYIYDASHSGQFVDISQSIAVTADTNYTLTAWIDGTTGGTLGARTTGGTSLGSVNFNATEPVGTDSNTYQQVTVSFNSGSNTSVVIYAGFTTRGSAAFIHMDDFSLTAGSTVQPPAAPTGLNASPGNGQVSLTWNAVSGAASYVIYRETTFYGEESQENALLDSTPPYQTGITGTSFTDTGLSNGTTYYYEVEAVNSGGSSGFSAIASATPSTGQVPAVPTNLTATAGDSQVSLTWNAVPDATGYNLYRGTSSGGEVLYLSNISSNSYLDISLPNGTTYYYQVTAVNDAGESGRSSEVSATPLATANLVQDPGFEDQNTSGNLIAPWSVNDPSGEAIGVEDAGTAHTGSKEAYFYQPGSGTAFSDVYQIVSVTPYTNYTLSGWFDNNDTSSFTGGEFGVQTNGGSTVAETPIPEIGPGNSSASYQQLTLTFNSGANTSLVVFGGYAPEPGSWMHMDDISLIGQPPATPTGLTATAGNGQVTLSWTAVSGAASYNIYRGTSSGSEVLYQSGVTSNASTAPLAVFTDTAASNGVTYYYQVTAVNAYGESGKSSEVSGTPQAAASTLLSSAFNREGIVTNGTTFSGGLDGDGYAYSANLLGSSVTWNGQTFSLGTPNTNNVVSAAGQTITLPAGNYSAISFLGTGVNGSQANLTFTVTYTDGSTQTFTQSFSDWFYPQGYSGESTVATLAYRDTAAGGTNGGGPLNLYGYSFALNGSKTVQSITLPNDANVELVAVSLTPATASGPNLVQDPGFEDQSNTSGAPLQSPWFEDGTIGSGVDVGIGTAHSGNKDAYLFSNGGGGFSDIGQIVNVQPNTNYTLSGWFDNSNNSGFTGGELAVRLRAAAGGTWIANAAIPETSSYQQVTVTFNSGNNTQLVILGGYTPGSGLSWMHMDDVSLIANAELLAGSPLANSNASALTQQQLAPAVNQAVQEWAGLGLSPTQVSALQHVQFVITTLPAGVLGETVGNTIYIDSNADGYGWSLGSKTAPNKVDLLTVVAHELGHELGLADVNPTTHPGDLMDATLPVGARRLPSAYDISLLRGALDMDDASFLAELLSHHRG